MIDDSDIKIYTFDNGIKKPVLLNKSDQTASSLYRFAVSIGNVVYWLQRGLTLHGSKTQKLDVNAYLIADVFGWTCVVHHQAAAEYVKKH